MEAQDGSWDGGTNNAATVANAFRKAREVDELKGELAVAKQQTDAAQRESRLLETERRKLIEQVTALEAQKRSLHQEVEQWRGRCLGFEQEYARLAVREDTVHAQLREAHTRERELAVKCIEGRITRTEAENQQASALAEARAQTWQRENLANKLEAKNLEAENLRDQTREARSHGEAWRAEVDSLKAQLQDSTSESDWQKQELVESERRQGVMEDRMQGLESAVQAATKKQKEFAADVAKTQAEAHALEETNRRLRLELQEAIGQAVRAGETPLYSGGNLRNQMVPACVQDLKEQAKDSVPMGPWKTIESDLPRPLASPRDLQSGSRSRLDYPRSGHAREMRQKVLNAREKAIDYIEELGREMPKG